MRELKASDLYGGRDKVMQAMREAVRNGLSKVSPEVLWEIKNYLPVSSSAIDRIINMEDVEVDYDLFSMLHGCCDSDIWDVVGKPNFDEMSKALWEAEMVKNPMISTGPSINLNMYVSCCLMREIGSNFREEWWRETAEDFIQKVKNIQEYQKSKIKA
jgi:hypothetical protein